MNAEIGGRLLVLDRAVLEDSDLSKASFDQLAVTSSTFVRCDFRLVFFEPKWQPIFSAGPRNVFIECHFERADLRRIHPGQARFEGCTFDDALLDGWTSYCAEFVDCHFSGRIVNVRFHGRPWGADGPAVLPPREINEFRGNDFRKAELIRSAFVNGLDVSAQRWPDGGEYVYLDRIHQRITRAHAEVMRWRDMEGKKAAVALLQATSNLYARQREIIVRKGDPPVPTPTEVEQRVIDSLLRAM